MSGGGGREDCFVATACFGDFNAAPVITLRASRDQVLAGHRAGRLFTRAYYRFGPHAANAIRHRPAARARARRLLGPIVAHAARRLGSQ